ncbi:MAG: FHA domain-containing protein, partial [Burkholderiales bacterium]|nr:FHA domain-containing protein [Anaerolineae bacterium]
VSRHHMRLTRGAGSYTLEDLGSTNGTFINSQRLTGAKPLNNNDMIGLGETVTLSYEMSRAQDVGMRPAENLAPMSPSTVPQRAAPPAVAAYSDPQQQPQQPPAAYEYSAPAYGSNAPAYGAPQAPAAAYSAPAYGAPQAPAGEYGEYDPYAVREEEPRSPMRWVLIGCAALSLFCCCGTVVGLVIVDQACLWDKVPVLSQVIAALGYSLTC